MNLLSKCEDEGWIEATNSNIMHPLIACLCKRKGLTLLEKVKGHAGITKNEGADKLAGQEARKTIPNHINLLS